MASVKEDVDDRYAGIDIDSLLNGQRRPLSFERKKALYEGHQLRMLLTEHVFSAIIKRLGAADNVAPEFIQRLNGEETVMEGQSLCIECKIRGFPVPYLRWFKDDEEILDDPHIHVESDGIGGYYLFIDHVTREDEAAYRCRAENVEGACSSFFFLSVKGQPKRKDTMPSWRTVSFPPMFSTIVEKVEEEERQGKEFEELPPSPLTEFYYAITLKSRCSWPTFLGDWAFVNNRHPFKRHSITSDDDDEIETEEDNEEDDISSGVFFIPNGDICDKLKYHSSSKAHFAAKRGSRKNAKSKTKKQKLGNRAGKEGERGNIIIESSNGLEIKNEKNKMKSEDNLEMKGLHKAELFQNSEIESRLQSQDVIKEEMKRMAKEEIAMPSLTFYKDAKDSDITSLSENNNNKERHMQNAETTDSENKTLDWIETDRNDSLTKHKGITERVFDITKQAYTSLYKGNEADRGQENKIVPRPASSKFEEDGESNRGNNSEKIYDKEDAQCLRNTVGNDRYNYNTHLSLDTNASCGTAPEPKPLRVFRLDIPEKGSVISKNEIHQSPNAEYLFRHNAKTERTDKSPFRYTVESEQYDKSHFIYVESDRNDRSPYRYSAESERYEKSPFRYNVESDRNDRSPNRYNAESYRNDRSPNRYNAESERNDRSPNRYNAESERNDRSPNRNNAESERNEKSPFRNNVQSESHEKSPYRYNAGSDRHDKSPSRYNVESERNERSPLRYNVEFERHEKSPYRYNAESERNDRSPFRYNIEAERHEKSPYRYNAESERNERSPFRYNIELERHEKSPFRYNVESERNERSPLRYNVEAERHEKSPYRYDAGSDSNERSPLRYNVESDRNERSPLRYDIVSEGHEKSPFRYNSEPDRKEKSPFRLNEPNVERQRALERSSPNSDTNANILTCNRWSTDTENTVSGYIYSRNYSTEGEYSTNQLRPNMYRDTRKVQQAQTSGKDRLDELRQQEAKRMEELKQEEQKRIEELRHEGKTNTYTYKRTKIHHGDARERERKQIEELRRKEQLLREELQQKEQKQLEDLRRREGSLIEDMKLKERAFSDTLTRSEQEQREGSLIKQREELRLKEQNQVEELKEKESLQKDEIILKEAMQIEDMKAYERKFIGEMKFKDRKYYEQTEYEMQREENKLDERKKIQEKEMLLHAKKEQIRKEQLRRQYEEEMQKRLKKEEEAKRQRMLRLDVAKDNKFMNAIHKRSMRLRDENITPSRSISSEKVYSNTETKQKMAFRMKSKEDTDLSTMKVEDSTKSVRSCFTNSLDRRSRRRSEYFTETNNDDLFNQTRSVSEKQSYLAEINKSENDSRQTNRTFGNRNTDGTSHSLDNDVPTSLCNKYSKLLNNSKVEKPLTFASFFAIEESRVEKPSLRTHQDLFKLAESIAAKRDRFHEYISNCSSEDNTSTVSTQKEKRTYFHDRHAEDKQIVCTSKQSETSNELGKTTNAPYLCATEDSVHKSIPETEAETSCTHLANNIKDGTACGSSVIGIRPFVSNSARTTARRFHKKD